MGDASTENENDLQKQVQDLREEVCHPTVQFCIALPRVDSIHRHVREWI